MKCVKELYGKTIIDSSDSDEISKDCQIELEYYHIENVTSSKPYGVEIVKRNIENNSMNIENKEINNICYNKKDNFKLLDILISNKVTPISVDDVIEDLTIIKVI